MNSNWIVFLFLCIVFLVSSCDSIQHLKVSQSDKEFHHIREKGKISYQQFDIDELIHVHVHSHLFQNQLLMMDFVIVNNGDRSISYEVGKLRVKANKKVLVFDRIGRDMIPQIGGKKSKIVDLPDFKKKFIIPPGSRIKVNYSLRKRNKEDDISLDGPILVSNSGFIINRKRDNLKFNLNK